MQFDSDAWLARLSGAEGAPDDMRDRAQAATRLLLAHRAADPARVRPTSRLRLVRYVVLDAAYQLK